MMHLRAASILVSIVASVNLVTSAVWAEQHVALSTAQGREVCVFGSASSESPFWRKGNQTTIHLLDLSTDNSQVVWKTMPYFFDLSISSNGNWIAFREPTDVPGYASLRVISSSGDTVALVGRVKRYVWSPDGNQVAYITGEPHEGGMGFSATGAAVLDVRSGQTHTIKGGNDSVLDAYDVTWASWDNGVYFQVWDGAGNECVRFDPVKGELTPAKLRGIYFSPSGDYYYYPGYDATEFELVRTDRNENIVRRLGIYEYAQARFWLDNETVVLIETKSFAEPFDTLVNVVDGTKVVVPGQVIGLGLDGSVLYVPRGGADEGKEFLARMPWKGSSVQVASAPPESASTAEENKAAPEEEEQSVPTTPQGNSLDESAPEEDTPNTEKPDPPAADVSPKSKTPSALLALGGLGLAIVILIGAIAWKRQKATKGSTAHLSR